MYMPSDVIVREGLIGDEMYIIGDGEVQVSLSNGVKVAILGRGTFFGEMALFASDQLRHSRVEAISICDIYSLKKVSLLTALTPPHSFVFSPPLASHKIMVVIRNRVVLACAPAAERDGRHI